MNTISRRQFIRSAFLSGAGVMTAGSFSSWVGCRSSCEAITPLPPRLGRRVLADLHVHPMLNKWNERSPIGVRNPLLAKAVEYGINPTDVSWKSSYEAGIDLICVAHFNMFDEWVTMPTDPNPEAPGNTLRMMDFLEEELMKPEAQAYAKLARSAEELKKILDVRRGDPGFRTAVVHALEGGHALGGRLDALDEFAKRGVAMIGITHFFNKGIGSSPNAYPQFPDANSRWPNQGLSEFGKDVVQRMGDLGVVIDVVHGTSAMIHDVFHEVSGPLVASHSSARSLGEHPYSLYDEHLEEISHRKGLVGIIIMPYWLSNFATEFEAEENGTLEDVVRTIVYVAKHCGTNCIGIGSDFSGFITGPKEMRCLGQIDKLRELVRREFSEDETEKIMAQNAIDFFLKNWGKNHTE
jgi:microsomal dipeptidase-like Zn-dependent dipeptidase